MRRDPDRLAALQRTMALDSPSERAYDDITRLLASSLEVPITIVNLLDDDRDWFKSCIGIPLSESPAATSFCETFFRMAEPTIVVEDTHADPRFARHPLVVGPPHIRFYAAARLLVRGQTLGTLCAYDFRPRTPTTAQIDKLVLLASSVVELLERRASGTTGEIAAPDLDPRSV